MSGDRTVKVGTDGKRKWTEMDWEIVMEAQSYIAVYAASNDDVEEEEATKPATKSKAKRAGASGRKTRGKGKPTPAPSTRPTRGRKKAKADEEEGQADDEEEGKEQEETAAAVEAKSGEETDEFWLAELYDDVTEDMLDTDASVRIRWLNKRSGLRYEYAFDDIVEVQSILCHVYMKEFGDDTLELTDKSLARVKRCVLRTKGLLPDGDDEPMEDDEKPPSSKRKKRAVAHGAGDDDDGEGSTKKRRGGGGGSRGGGGAKKLSKRQEAMHIPPKYAKVDASKYEDTEVCGKHDFHVSKDDTMATSKEVIRAVLTKNHKLLKKLTEDKKLYKEIHSYSMHRSVDVKISALKYAVQNDDLVAAGLLWKAREIESKLLAKKPEMSLPSHSTGKHTSSFSDYNRRALNASRGGKEGNNALMEDQDGCVATSDDEFNAPFDCSTTTVKMFTLLYPTGGWDNYGVPFKVAKVCRNGNFQLANKLIETLSRNGGWGFNDLHGKVLSDKGEALPAFRGVSAIKQAHQSRMRPLHLAAINPNTKYLEALWDIVGDEWSSAKDDLAFEPIHYAAACESTAPLAFLLERKCNMFARTKRRQTPIMRAIATCREANAIFIMDKAAEQDQELLGKVIAERGPGSFQPIHYAAKHGCAKVLEHLLNNHADINSVCEGKLTPLCLAAREGHYDCVKVLLDHNAKVDTGDKLKKTPLLFAVKNGHTRIAALLINNGANVNAYDTSENSVAHYAASYGWKSCLELLADAGADFWAKNSWGFVPLTCALLKQRLLCSEFILERDPNQRFLDFRDRQGCTMLFLQCTHSKNVSQIKYLLDKGLNPNIPNSENVYPLQALLLRANPIKPDSTDDNSADSFCADAIRLLLENKALPHYDIVPKLKVPGSDEVDLFQPLQIAIQSELKDVFLLLLDVHEADPNKQNLDGLDAWMTAVWRGSKGEFFLETLLKRHHDKQKNKKLLFATVDTDGENIFHCIGSNEMDAIIDPKLVRELIKKCENPTALLNQKNKEGETPLQKLLKQERSIPAKDISKPQHADLLEQITRADMRYSEIVEIFAEYATTEPSWVLCVDEVKAKNGVSIANTDTVETTVDAADASDDGSGSGSGSGSGGDSESNNSSDDDEDEDDEDEEEESPVEPASSADQAPIKLVKFTSILHAAANRKLQLDTKLWPKKWYGRNLVTVLLKKIKFDQATVDMPDYTRFKTALDYAVQHRDAESVRELLKNKADPNHSPVKCDTCTKDKKPCHCPGRKLVETALIVATRNDDREITRLLLETNRADVNCFEKDTLNRPLHLALAANSARITMLLLDHKADLSKLNSVGASPLHLAVQARHSVLAKQPHEGEVQYTDFNSTQKSTSDSLSAISEALRNNQAKDVVTYADAKKRTPVHLAAANRDLDLLRALVGASANKKHCVNKRDMFGRTPLHFAVNASSMSPDASFEIERFLLQSGADPNAMDEFQFSVLHFALFKVNLDWHFRYDADKDKAEAGREREEGTFDKKKADAFLEVLASIPSNPTDPVETVSNLTSIQGINVVAQDILGRTPLHLAAATGAFVCASSLLAVHSNASDKQAALAIVDLENFTSLGRAVEYLRQTTIMTLLQNGADVSGQIMIKKKRSEDGENEAQNVEDECKKTCSYFYHAVKHSLTGICHMLLNAKFSKRQAVEDALLCGQFQLASNLMVGIEVSSGNALLAKPNETGDTLLHSLAQVDKPFDDLAKSIAWNLIDAGLKANIANKQGYSPLHYAAKMGNIHLIDFLLHNKCNMNHPSKTTGETPLLYALKRSKLRAKEMVGVLKYCLENTELDIHAKDKTGMNVLSAFLDRFVSGTESIDSETFFKWTQSLLKKGVDPNGFFSSNQRKDFFQNGLFGSSLKVQVPAIIRAVYADSSSKRCSLLGLLLQFGAKVTAADSNGNSLLMHLAANNMIHELHLVTGKTKTVRDPVDPASKKMHAIHIPAQDIKEAVGQVNHLGQTALHIAVKPLVFGSHENVQLLELLISSGASLQARDKAKRTPVDYTTDQASRFLYRFLHTKFPKIASKGEHEVFDDVMEEWEVVPDYTADAAAYIEECKANGKISMTKVHPEPNENCDVGSLKRVYGPVDEAKDKVISGEEYDALLTKVDVKNGRFGLNVFYRCQIVQDQIQGLFVVFTNWGRIGETGKFQNTPFHSPDDAITEFKKIFRSKTSNHWHEREAFVKHAGKYNLVQRVNYHTKLNDEITLPFVEAVDGNANAFVDSKRNFAASVTEMLFAITDVRNLQLAATESSNFQGSLPLANADELRAAVDRLVEIRDVIEARDKLDEELQKVRGDMSDSAATQLAQLSQQHADMTEEVSEKSSRYYEVMPCDEESFGSSIKAFNSVGDVNGEITRLRLLIGITHTYKMLLGAKRFQSSLHPLDYCYDAIQVNIAPLTQDAEEAKLLTSWFFKGLRSYQKKQYRISNIFQVSRNGEKTRFMETLDGKPTLKTKHSQLLWHGTKRTNLMGILSQGLRIAPPEAPHHGYMYGKGLYFANVAAKSLAYCDSGYTISSMTKDVDGNHAKKKRDVHYLLACEVALGASQEPSGLIDYTKPMDEVESIRAPGKHLPDPSGAIVSPLSGAALPLGTVGQVGVAFPYPVVWAKTDSSLTQWDWKYNNLNTTAAAQEFWAKIVADNSEGQTYTLEHEEATKYFYGCHDASKKITAEILTKGDSSAASESGFFCDATIKMAVKEENGREYFSWQVKRLRNAFKSSTIGDGFKLLEPDRSEYEELIVYNEGQARIRYLVEVETL